MNRNPVDTIDSLPEEAFLLPWYVNGTLDAEDRGRVEAALAQSAELREELELLRAVERSVVASTDAMPDPDPDGFARLMARIDAEPQRTAQPAASQGRGLLARVAGWFEVSWRPAMAAAALVIAVQAAAIVALVGDRGEAGGQFQTASGASGTGDARFLVGFADGALLGDIRALLERADAVIVKGPTADGYFVVAAQGDAAQAQSTLQSAANLVTQAERMP
ncbi:hypothetical protein EDC65_1643 [Stella humosa]|uniref:Uncharacterized protein n=1 Tax=Stella humosa TaxID=94 RepID=A0A3N1M810_9PROT|nr:hypothetical protein [Stella humosa]ROP99852.1 hypothetical protein EDC65_1643 [Stella humosa]BBK30919.1 hypothetical protein STHU_15530 [Stella humosa]